MGRRWLVIAIALAGLGLSLSLGLERDLPGCGPRSACVRVARLGDVPWIGWPIAHVGSAYFAGIVAAALGARGRAGARASRAAGVVLGLGGLASVALVGVMAGLGEWCAYCVMVHLLNLGLIGALVRARRREAGPARDAGPRARSHVSAIAFACTFALATLALAAVEAVGRSSAGARARAEMAGSVGAIESGEPAGRRFQGRYVRGPADASIRVVIFSDAQCEDCRRVEGEVVRAAERRGGFESGDVSISIKHFPFCTDCNRHMPRNMHPRACEAARAMEAAGLAGGGPGTEGGSRAFWGVREWIVARGGVFTRDDLATEARRLGLDAPRVLALLDGEESLRVVRADVEEGVSLGLHFTPLVFVNGVELRGWRARSEAERAIGGLDARGLGGATSVGRANDQPVDARRKYLDDWLAQARQPSPARAWDWGPAREGGVEVVVFGDYQEAFTRRADAEIRALARAGRVRYSFRHFPVDPSCNPASPARLHAGGGACAAALAAEGARAAGGPEAFRVVHEALMAGDATSEASVGAIVGALGTAGGAGDAVVRGDGAAGRALGLDSLPMIFVGGRRVPRWLLGDESVLEDMVEWAESEPGPPAR